VKQPLGADGFARLTGADPAQIERLTAYFAILERWQSRINLVGRSSLADPWRRHALDSAQLVPLLPPRPARLADLGTGAGFPGLVLAILSDIEVTLVESDLRKCAFLAEAARATGSDVQIRPVRIESDSPRAFDVVTARALAPLPHLLGLAWKWVAPQGVCLLLKGQAIEGELTDAAKTWKMQAATIPSLSDPSGTVLKVEQLRERDDR